MPDAANPDLPDHSAGDALPGGLSDEAALAAHAATLASAVIRALPGWVVRSVVEVADQYRPGLGADLMAPATSAGQEAAEVVGGAVRSLLAQDVDEQATGPLALLRGAVRYPTEVLAAAGIPAVVRDDFAERAFPDDRYGLAPAGFADIHPALHEPGLVWGAAKAHVVLARRRAEGRR